MKMHGMNMTMPPMWSYFHTTIDDIVLFHWWTVRTVGGLLISCSLLFVFSIACEGLKYLRARLSDRCGNEGPFQKQWHQLVGSTLYSVQIGWSYLLMLSVMTYSVWIGLSVVLGALVGHLLFTHLAAVSDNETSGGSHTTSGDKGCSSSSVRHRAKMDLACGTGC